eukprot:TRINITY_DN46122_c0_g1_i1.p1 TRINITY_DN46122_c0_g1~~TRINITY_DN46122_c0_g1_i1.p1  ORF type:complete len:185 (+),score=28.08 TRINITY_DN46122_c0_g1_i1:63-617(+)
MGQKLAGTCCVATQFEDEEQVPPLTSVEFAKPIIGDARPLEPLRTMPARGGPTLPAPRVNFARDGADELERELSDMISAVPCRSCCTSPGPGVSPSSQATTAGSPTLPPPGLRTHSRSAGLNAADEVGIVDGHFCMSPRTSPESDWNDAGLVEELNIVARSLSLQFKTLPSLVKPDEDAKFGLG